MTKPSERPRILAVASKGGHWIQLMRLRPAWMGCDVSYVSTDKGNAHEIEKMNRDSSEPPARFHAVPDASRSDWLALVAQTFAVLVVLLRVRPNVIVTTGAAPGFFAIVIGRLFGARTIWIDSIANADEVSLSGRKIRRYATLWLTQWPHLSGGEEPRYEGSVL